MQQEILKRYITVFHLTDPDTNARKSAVLSCDSAPHHHAVSLLREKFPMRKLYSCQETVFLSGNCIHGRKLSSWQETVILVVNYVPGRKLKSW